MNLSGLYTARHAWIEDIFLIEKDDQVAPNNFGKSVEVTLGEARMSGWITEIVLRSAAGSGIIQIPALSLYLFYADPLLTPDLDDIPGTPTQQAERWSRCLGYIPVPSTAWDVVTASQGVASLSPEKQFNSSANSIWIAARNLGGTTINDSGADDETITASLGLRFNS